MRSTPRPSPRTRPRKGYSLIEVMIALVVLGFGLLTLATMQIIALQQGSAGRHTGDASATARSYLEQMHRVDWSVLTAAVAAGPDAAVFWTGVGSSVDVVATEAGGSSSVEHSYDVRWTVTDVNACLRDVEVKVLWAEEGYTAPKNVRVSTRRYNWGAAGC